jgi:hypothetical protein
MERLRALRQELDDIFPGETLLRAVPGNPRTRAVQKFRLKQEMKNDLGVTYDKVGCLRLRNPGAEPPVANLHNPTPLHGADM